MCTKENEVKNYIEQDRVSLFKKEFVEAATRIVVTSVSVASVLHPLDVRQTRMQAGASKLSFNMPFLFSYKNIQPFLKGFWHANTSSLRKNSVLANRDTISKQVDDVIGEKENNKQNKYSLLLTASIITTLDTTVNQYSANQRVLSSLGLLVKLPLKQKFRFAKIGLCARGLKNFAVTFAYISATNLGISNPFLSEKYPLINKLMNHTFFAFLVSPCIALETVYKRIIAGMNLQSLQTPTYAQVVKSMWQEGGMKTFFRGSLLNGINTTLAFLTINGVNYLLDSYLFAENKSTFFPPRKAQPVEQTEQQPTEMAKP